MVVTDREKVIKAIEICKDKTDRECTKCPYRKRTVCLNSMLSDALELLKEQQKKIEKLESDKGWDESPDMMGKW